MAARRNGEAVFVTFTPDDNNSIIISFYADETERSNLREITENDIHGIEKRISVAGKNAFARSLFFSTMLEPFIEEILRFDVKKEIEKRWRLIWNHKIFHRRYRSTLERYNSFSYRFLSLRVTAHIQTFSRGNER